MQTGTRGSRTWNWILCAGLLCTVVGLCAYSLHGRGPPKNCLVLSVGAGKGLAHAGAIEALKLRGVPVHGVVGNSMGAVVGSLYAVDPQGDVTASARRLLDDYATKTRSDTGATAGLMSVLGFLVAGPLGLAAGGAFGAAAVPKLDRDRFMAVLDAHIRHARFRDLSLPFVTSFFVMREDNFQLQEVTAGSVAAAVGGSVANPYIFKNQKIRSGDPIDPGGDRLSAVPLDLACRRFPGHRLIAINVTGESAAASLGMDCTVVEVRVNLAEVNSELALSDVEAFDRVVAVGREATLRALARAELGDEAGAH